MQQERTRNQFYILLCFNSTFHFATRPFLIFVFPCACVFSIFSFSWFFQVFFRDSKGLKSFNFNNWSFVFWMTGKNWKTSIQWTLSCFIALTNTNVLLNTFLEKSDASHASGLNIVATYYSNHEFHFLTPSHIYKNR